MKGVKDRVVYTASKDAVLSMTRAMAADYVEDKVRINAICPGTSELLILLGNFSLSKN